MDRPKKPNNYVPGQSTGPRPRSGMRHYGGNTISDVYNSCARKLGRMSNLELFLLAILGGAFMCVAAFASVLLMSIAGTTNPALLSALVLSAGLLFVIMTKSALFTEANIYVPGNFYNLSLGQSWLRLFRFWLIVWFGNLIGALLFAFLVSVAQGYSETFQTFLENIMAARFTHAGHIKETAQLVISGMLANWLIAVASIFAIASRNLVNQFILLFLVFILIYVTNFQYFPVNLGYAALDAFLGNNKFGFANLVFENLIPVGLGNILGATLLVAGPMLFLSKKR